MTANESETESSHDVGVLGRPHVGSHCIHPDAMAWIETDTPGFWIKMLYDESGVDAAGKSRGNTQLMRVDAGAFAEMHAHDQLEEILVLDGEFTDQYTTYRPGDFCVRAIGEPHIAGSETGCTVLLVYRD